jgi:hypothetical protein
MLIIFAVDPGEGGHPRLAAEGPRVQHHGGVHQQARHLQPCQQVPYIIFYTNVVKCREDETLVASDEIFLLVVVGMKHFLQDVLVGL